MTTEWRASDPEPPVGTVLEVGNPGRPWEGAPGDLLTFIRFAPNAWVEMHNRAPRSMRPVPLTTVAYWAPLRVIGASTSDDYSDYHEQGTVTELPAAA